MATNRRVYAPIRSEDYELCRPRSDSVALELYRTISGRPCAQTWVAPEMVFIRENMGRTLIRSDAPWFHSFALIFRENVVGQLGDLLLRAGELLPAMADTEKLFIYNPWIVPNAVNLAASGVARARDGRLRRIDRPAFIGGQIADVCAFKINLVEVSQTYVSERFVGEWQRGGFEGLRFREVWNGASGKAP